jgi:hypothetical protein
MLTPNADTFLKIRVDTATITANWHGNGQREPDKESPLRLFTYSFLLNRSFAWCLRLQFPPASPPADPGPHTT